MMDFFKGTVTRKDWMTIGAILGSTLLAGTVYVLLVHAQQRDRLTSLTAELDSAKVELQKALDTKKNIEKLQAEMDKVAEVVQTFERRLPNHAEMPQLLKDFERIAADVGLEVVLKSQDPVVDARKETLPYSVVARGSFHQITGFINQLELFKRFLSISNLEITEQKNGVAEAKFTLSTYSFRQPGARPAPPAGGAPAAKSGSAA